MPETKDKTLEEIDLIFSQPTSKLVAQNWKNVKETTHDPSVDFSQGKHEVGHQA
jgi:hypothetical protein